MFEYVIFILRNLNDCKLMFHALASDNSLNLI